MALPVLLRLPHPQTGTTGDPTFVIVHVSSAGPSSLDLHLVATENTAVFAVSSTNQSIFDTAVQHNQTSSLRVKNSPCNQEEWDEVLSYVLLDAGPGGTAAGPTDGVEAIAKVENDGSSITITIQKRVEGITQRLGTITLLASEDEVVDLYEWCGFTVKSKNALTDELRALKIKSQEQEQRIQMLDESFHELIKVKNDHEIELLEKFSRLLNAKKLKIRDQQRLLASASIDPAKLEAVEASRARAELRAAGTSRAGKRKADVDANVQSDDNESGGGFEQMDIDNPLLQDSEQEQAQTPDDESTADETDDMDNEAAPQIQPVRKRTQNETKIAKGKAERETGAKGSTSTTRVGEDEPPPRRELPFGIRRSNPAAKPATTAAAATAAPDEGSETESDDEL